MCNSCQSFKLHWPLSPKPFNFGYRCFGVFRYSLTQGTLSRSLVRSSCYTLYISNHPVYIFRINLYIFRITLYMFRITLYIFRITLYIYFESPYLYIYIYIYIYMCVCFESACISVFFSHGSFLFFITENSVLWQKNCLTFSFFRFFIILICPSQHLSHFFFVHSLR